MTGKPRAASASRWAESSFSASVTRTLKRLLDFLWHLRPLRGRQYGLSVFQRFLRERPSFLNFAAHFHCELHWIGIFRIGSAQRLRQRPHDGVGLCLKAVTKHPEPAFLCSGEVEFQGIVEIENLRERIWNSASQPLSEIIGRESCPGAGTGALTRCVTRT